MKKELGAIIILFGLIGLSVWNLFHLRQLTGELTELINESSSLAGSGEWDAALAAARRAESTWLSADGYTHIFMRHAEADSTTDAFCDYISELEKCDSCADGPRQKLIEHLKSLYDIEKPTLKSIF